VPAEQLVPGDVVEVTSKLVELRDKRTEPEHFRRAARRISVLLAAAASGSSSTSSGS